MTSSQTKRYLGLELSGAKNQKTSVAAIEFYPKEKKTFLLDIFDRIAPHDDQSGDDALLEVLREIGSDSGESKMGVNVSLELPPCINCKRKVCPLPADCSIPAVKWMRETAHKASKNPGHPKIREFTPYTQRPIELWARYSIFSEMENDTLFEIDETLGGNRAPLTARMNFLKRHLNSLSLIEVWPKLTVTVLASQLNIQKRIITSYRHLEDGIHSREVILETLAKKYEIFIYDRDMKKLSQNLTAFDAFICAFTALLADQDLCAKVPKGFPVSSGWVHYPELEQKT